MNNKHGLSRNISERTKEIIRRRDGFGCVHCGRGIYTYEHFNPTFNEAKEHNVDGIALLCGQCQILTTKGILSKETIQDDVNNPFCKRQGYSNDFFDLNYPISIYYGNFEYLACKGNGVSVILKVNNELTLSCSEDPIGGPVQLSALFRDKSNNICLEIVKNEWKASTDNWDIKQVGNKLDIYNSNKEIGIQVEVNPPNAIIFRRFKTYFNGSMLVLDKQKILIKKADGRELEIFTPNIQRRAAPIVINL